MSGKISGWFSIRHKGIDIVAPCGRKVRAVSSGRILLAGWKGNGGGLQVWEDNNGPTGTGYYHLSKVAVSRGQSVQQGQTIGYVGSTGHSTGCHLHFEVWHGTPWNGHVHNPMAYLK